MNILFILPEYYPHSGGGIATYYKHYIEALKPHCNKIKVIVGSAYTQSNEVFTVNGVEIEYLKPQIYHNAQKAFTRYDLFPEYRDSLASAWAMWQQANKGEGFDIIECTDFGLGFVPWVVEHHLPVITRLHGSMGQIALHENPTNHAMVNELFMKAELSLLPLSDQLVTHSKNNYNYWNRIFSKQIVQHIHPIYIREPQEKRNKQEFGLVVGRIQKWKGPVELCKAVEKLTNPPEVRWVGRDMPFDTQQSTADFLKKSFIATWEKKIKPVQRMPNTEVQLLQQQALFGIVPSVWDMFNFTCLEFLATGTIVICSDGAGASELIEYGVNGFKYSATDSTALADCIQLAYNLDGNTYQQIINAGFETLDSKLSSEKLIPVYIGLYQNAINNFAASTSNEYISTVYGPSAKYDDTVDLLNKQSLSKLSAYTLNRLYRKIIK